uniref:Uncharacterized protein n=1 Tax=Romanomermis culicivorax TaxID=13658 RepID=A0A915HG55_ROMCU
MDWLMNNAGSKFSSLLKKYKGAFDSANYGGEVGGADNGSSSSACHSHQQHHFRLSEPPLRRRTINDHHHYQDHSLSSRITYENAVAAKEQDSKECSLKLVDSQNRKFSILVHDESDHFNSNIPVQKPARSPSNIELIINQFTDQDCHSPIRRKSTLTPNFDTENVNASESIIDQSLAAQDPSFRDLKLIYDQLPNPSAAKRKTLCDCAGQVVRKSALPKYSQHKIEFKDYLSEGFQKNEAKQRIGICNGVVRSTIPSSTFHHTQFHFNKRTDAESGVAYVLNGTKITRPLKPADGRRKPTSTPDLILGSRPII